jgi:hypothetical protein
MTVDFNKTKKRADRKSTRFAGARAADYGLFVLPVGVAFPLLVVSPVLLPVFPALVLVCVPVLVIDLLLSIVLPPVVLPPLVPVLVVPPLVVVPVLVIPPFVIVPVLLPIMGPPVVVSFVLPVFIIVVFVRLALTLALIVVSPPPQAALNAAIESSADNARVFFIKIKSLGSS